MILGASYNFFNGEEHLEASVRSIRNQIDHISVVYQKISNKGNPISEEALDVLSKLQRDGLVDEVRLYDPDLTQRPGQNETIKRKIGIEIAKHAGMTHFLSIDADEFYRETELKTAKNFIDEYHILNTSVGSFMHIRSPNWRARDRTDVPFITKITSATYIGRRYFIRHVDPTRKIMTPAPLWMPFSLPPFWKRFHYFDTSVIAMYHMNLVRKDLLRSKFKNSSTNNNAFFQALEKSFANWVPGEPFYFPGKGLMQVTYVPNEFNTWSPEDDDGILAGS